MYISTYGGATAQPEHSPYAKSPLPSQLNRTPIVGLKKFRFDDRRCGFLCVGIAGVVAGPRLGTPATLGVAGVGVGTDFVSLTTLWRAYRRQRYRSWSSADAEGAFCVVCVQFLGPLPTLGTASVVAGPSFGLPPTQRMHTVVLVCQRVAAWRRWGGVMSPIPTPPY